MTVVNEHKQGEEYFRQFHALLRQRCSLGFPGPCHRIIDSLPPGNLPFGPISGTVTVRVRVRLRVRVRVRVRVSIRVRVTV